MIGALPEELIVGSRVLKINADYRNILRIFDAFSDPDGSEQEKTMFMLEHLYKNPELIEDLETAILQAIWFLNCGQKIQEQKGKPVYDWKQDESMIFSAVNKIAGIETRSIQFIHYWTWIGYFNEVGESLFSTVIGIRDKLNKKKKLEKHEEEFYRKNHELVKLSRKYSQKEKEELEMLNGIV